MAKAHDARELDSVVPSGELVHLRIEAIRPSPHNPRQLFDPEPLAALRASIRDHGVLVPLTVYTLPGQNTYSIVDGERRYRCCVGLSKEGMEILIPANVVAPPQPVASLIYMFNIHQFRQQWELMPTAVALRSVIDKLNVNDERELAELTGLSERQIERCKVILSFGDRYQQMSLDSDPTKRVPSNFWVELHPVLDLAERLVPDVVAKEGRDGITDRLVDKYQSGRIKSVIHFRRILEAYDVQEESEQGIEAVGDQLREYLLTPTLETREAFDGFITDSRRVHRATQAADRFVKELNRARISHTIDDKEELIKKLASVVAFVQGVLAKLEGEDPPVEEPVEPV